MLDITAKKFAPKDALEWLKKRPHICLLALIAIISFMLNFYAVSKFGYANAYYAAAIRSMIQSPKNFFFVSFDPAGIVMVDKPPLALWIQALFVLIFGYHGWAMLLPQAIAGTLSCIMMYNLTAKHFGRPAGLLAALFFALTPAAVVASRNNTMDMQLVFMLLVVTWYFFKALETSKKRYLFLAALFMGLAFNIKMLQAYMILPAIGFVYLVFSKEKFLKRILSSFIALLIVVAVSFSWVLAVDLYPEGKRPFVGSSTDNSVMELIIGHNGLQRLYRGSMMPRSGSSFFGGMGGSNSRAGAASGGTTNQAPFQGNTSGSQGTQQGASQGSRQSGQQPQSGQAQQAPSGQQSQSGQTQQAPSGRQSQGSQQAPPEGQTQQAPRTNTQGGQQGFSFPQGQTGFGAWTMTRTAGGNNISIPGFVRLWSKDLYGQASWLIVFALFGLLAMARKFSFKSLSLKKGIIVYWSIWLAIMCLFFSFASFYHRYYFCMFAPAVAAISGVGFSEMFKAFKDKTGWKQYLLPASLLTTSLISVVYLLMFYKAVSIWLVPLILVTTAAAVVFMAVHYLKGTKPFTMLTAGFMLLSILAGPFYWSLTAALYPPQNSTMPYAGPELADATQYGGSLNQETFITSDRNTQALEKYLVAHYKEGSYLVVSQSSADVAAIIVDTGLPAVAYGGFLGTDAALTLDRIKALVQEGKIRYFLLSSTSNGNFQITNFVRTNAKLIDVMEYDGTNGSGYSLYLFS